MNNNQKQQDTLEAKDLDLEKRKQEIVRMLSKLNQSKQNIAVAGGEEDEEDSSIESPLLSNLNKSVVIPKLDFSKLPLQQ